MSDELTVWKPNPFEGTDLLPIACGGPVDDFGRDNIEAEDLIIPTIKLLQGMSEETMDEDLPEARAGKLFHTGTQDVFDGPLRVLLCAHTKSRAMFPKDDDPAYAGKETCLSRDGVTGEVYGACSECPNQEWRENRQPPLCSESHNFTALTPHGPAILRFARTSYKAARKFLTTWRMSPHTLFTYPAQISIKRDSKEVRGKQVTYYRMEMKWLTQETVPPSAQAAARAIAELVDAAHAQGRFAGDDERTSDRSFDDIPL